MINLQPRSEINQVIEGTGEATLGPRFNITTSPFRLIQYIDGTIHLICLVRTHAEQSVGFQDTVMRYVAVTEQDRERIERSGRVGQYKGQTQDGFSVNVQGMYLIDAYLRPVNTRDVDSGIDLTFVFVCKEARFTKNTETAVNARFSLLNLEYSDGSVESSPGIRKYQTDPPSLEELKKPLQTGNTYIDIVPVENYHEVIQELTLTHGVDITCIATTPITENEDTDALEARITDVCLILTFARGIRVDWLNYELISANDVVIGAVWRSNHIIKRFQSGAVSKPVLKHQSKILNNLRLGSAYPRLAQAREDWDIEHAIDIYIDAKVAGDLLISRGLKAVVTMEILKAKFKNPYGQKGTVISRSHFKRLRKALEITIKDTLKEIDVPFLDEAYTNISDHIPGLNYYPFSLSLMCMFHSIDFSYPGLELEASRFTKIRNNLVHYGLFMEDHRDYGTPVEQLDFLLEFVERFLAAVLLSIEQHGTLYRMHGSSWRWPHARKKAEQQADTPKSEDVSPMNRQS